MITLRLSDFKSQASLSLLLIDQWRRFFYFLVNQSTKFIDLKATRKPVRLVKSLKNSTYDLPSHFINKIKTKGYDVIGVNR